MGGQRTVQQETSQTVLIGALKEAGYSTKQAQELLQLAERLRNPNFDFDAYSRAQAIGNYPDVERVTRLWSRFSPSTTSLTSLSADQARQIVNSKEFTSASNGFVGPQVGISVKWPSDTSCQVSVGNVTYTVSRINGNHRPNTEDARNREDLLILESARGLVQSREITQRAALATVPSKKSIPDLRSK